MHPHLMPIFKLLLPPNLLPPFFKDLKLHHLNNLMHINVFKYILVIGTKNIVFFPKNVNKQDVAIKIKINIIYSKAITIDTF
jgi:hypothetical protein